MCVFFLFFFGVLFASNTDSRSVCLFPDIYYSVHMVFPPRLTPANYYRRQGSALPLTDCALPIRSRSSFKSAFRTFYFPLVNPSITSQCKTHPTSLVPHRCVCVCVCIYISHNTNSKMRVNPSGACVDMNKIPVQLMIYSVWYVCTEMCGNCIYTIYSK